MTSQHFGRNTSFCLMKRKTASQSLGRATYMFREDFLWLCGCTQIFWLTYSYLQDAFCSGRELGPQGSVGKLNLGFLSFKLMLDTLMLSLFIVRYSARCSSYCEYNKFTAQALKSCICTFLILSLTSVSSPTCPEDYWLKDPISDLLVPKSRAVNIFLSKMRFT